jgi:hypothetical protein
VGALAALHALVVAAYLAAADGEHDELLKHGWTTRKWTARKGYAITEEAMENSASETVWCSPHCNPEINVTNDLFAPKW